MEPISSMGARPWHSQYDEGVPATLVYPNLTVDEVLRESVSQYKEQPALIFFGRNITYGELDRLVDRLAGGLQKLSLIHI